MSAIQRNGSLSSGVSRGREHALGRARVNRRKLLRRMWNLRSLYLMVIPGVVFLFVFNYIPMAGLQVAFKDYQYKLGIWRSPWVGTANFEFIRDPQFWTAVRNTFAITSLRFIFGFPAPIILALLINEMRQPFFKRFVQTVSYIPHFVSWIVVVALLQVLLSPETGAVNALLAAVGLPRQFFMGSEAWFRPLVVLSGLWKEIGWGSIIYLAAIASINPELFEAAIVEGAGKLQQVRYITIPSIMPTISILLVLNIPGLLSAGWDQIYPMMTPANMGAAEVIDTFVLRLGVLAGKYSMTAAIGFVMSILSTTLILTVNWLSKRSGGSGIW